MFQAWEIKHSVLALMINPKCVHTVGASPFHTTCGKQSSLHPCSQRARAVSLSRTWLTQPQLPLSLPSRQRGRCEEGAQPTGPGLDPGQVRWPLTLVLEVLVRCSGQPASGQFWYSMVTASSSPCLPCAGRDGLCCPISQTRKAGLRFGGLFGGHLNPSLAVSRPHAL